jgi:FixJ family two-component response regulator
MKEKPPVVFIVDDDEAVGGSLAQLVRLTMDLNGN